MAALVDASSPIRWSTVSMAATGTSTSALFTNPANSLIVVCHAFDGSSNAGFGGTYGISDSGLLTWTKIVERTWDETTTGGESAIWYAVAASSVARTIVMTRASGANPASFSAKAYVITGADIAGTPIDTVGANNEGGSTTNSINTTSITPGADGLLIVSDCDFTDSGAFQASSDLTQDTASVSGITACSGYKTCSNGVGVTGNLNAAGSGAVQHKWCQVTVRATAGGAGVAAPRSLILSQALSQSLNW